MGVGVLATGDVVPTQGADTETMKITFLALVILPTVVVAQTNTAPPLQSNLTVLLQLAQLQSLQRADQQAAASQAAQAEQTWQAYDYARNRNTARTELYVSRARAVLAAASDSLFLTRTGPVGQRFWSDGGKMLVKLGAVDGDATNQQMSDALVSVMQQYRQAALAFVGHVFADVNARTAALKSTPAQRDSIVAAVLAAVDPVYQSDLLTPADSIHRTIAPILESFRAPPPAPTRPTGARHSRRSRPLPHG